MSPNLPPSGSPNADSGPSRPGPTEHALALANLLDKLLSTLAQATRGGENRQSTAARSESWDQRFELLERETLTAIKVEDAKNKRNAARRKQQKRKRTMERKL